MEKELDEAPKEKKNEAKPASSEEQQPGAFGKLTAGQLVKHEAYHNAVRGLKEGQLTEEEFLAMFSHQQRQGMFKMMESSRSENMALKWKSIRGPGTGDKKKPAACLHKRRLEKSQLSIEQTVQQGWESTKSTAWVSWKQITDDYGKDETIQRLQAGLIRMRKDAEAWKKGLKLYQFLKVEEGMKMGRGGNQAMTGCSSGATTEEQGATLARAMKSVQAADEDFFDAAWLGKGPKNASIEDWQLTESEALDAASQHESENDMAVFLAGLGVAGSSTPGKRRRVEDASPEACKKAKPSKEAFRGL